MAKDGITCIIAGAGRGKRFGKEIPKSFFRIEGRTLLARSIESINIIDESIEFIVLVPSGWEEKAEEKLAAEVPDAECRVIAGGNSRQQSVNIGLDEIKGARLILIHDACRPFVSPGLVRKVVDAGMEFRAAVPVLQATETLARIRDERLEGIVPRERVVRIQTPQAFDPEIIREAYDTAEESIRTATDESSLVLAAGLPVKVVEGEIWNIKVTFKDDIKVALSFLTEKKLDLAESE
ncbi:MAG TPA: 2-C-methyl-D-erythritol 4-phosphate cytidylyltransferase [Candidatus Krumholzibacteriaceae bacterium]|nr:2-C-methyl-D-erythritol 4-phosphate cytidylyltransferase [Candidatus Krumholzibacteriaceae bacterium]